MSAIMKRTKAEAGVRKGEEERQQAPRLYQTLCWARERLKDGETDREALERQAADSLGKAGFRVEYFAIRRAADLELPDEQEGPSVLLAAAWLGQTRLIDNVLADGPD